MKSLEIKTTIGSTIVEARRVTRVLRFQSQFSEVDGGESVAVPLPSSILGTTFLRS